MADQLARMAAASGKGINLTSFSSSSGPPRPPTPVHIIEGGDIVTRGPDEPPTPDPNGDVQCHICQEQFKDNLVLKEHFEKVHPKEMFHCTIAGCDKIFSTRKSRNRHSQNENLHKHLPPMQQQSQQAASSAAAAVAAAGFSLTAAAVGGGGDRSAAVAAALKMSGLHSLNHHHMLKHHLHEMDSATQAPLHVD